MNCAVRKIFFQKPYVLVPAFALGAFVIFTGALAIAASTGHRLGALQGLNALSTPGGISFIFIGGCISVVGVVLHFPKKKEAQPLLKEAQPLLKTAQSTPKETKPVITNHKSIKKEIYNYIKFMIEPGEEVELLFIASDLQEALTVIRHIQKGHSQVKAQFLSMESPNFHNDVKFPDAVIVLSDKRVNLSLLKDKRSRNATLFLSDGREMVINRFHTTVLSDSKGSLDAWGKEAHVIVEEGTSFDSVVTALSKLEKPGHVYVYCDAKMDWQGMHMLLPSLLLDIKERKDAPTSTDPGDSVILHCSDSGLH